MIKKNLLINFSILVFCCSATACAQNSNTDGKLTSSENIKVKKTQPNMDLSKITNTEVKAAMSAWQNGDSKTFLSYFTNNPAMTDDGNHRDFLSFVQQACGEEKFLTIDKVENGGKNITGNFHAGKWGTFKVFFRFHQNAEGKFDRLDIGQAN